MNVLIAADYCTPASGNFIGSVLELGHVLKKNNGNAVFMFPKNENTEKEESWTNWLRREGFQVILVDKNASPKEQLECLLSVISEYNIDILHLHFGMFNKLILLYRYKFRKVKVIAHDHFDFDPAVKKGLIYHLLKSILFGLCRVNIVCVLERKMKGYFFCRHKWVVPNGISFRRNIIESETRENCRERLGIREDEKICMFLGWDVWSKGLDIAIKAIDQARKTIPELSFAAVGIGVGSANENAAKFIEERTGISAASEWIKYLPNTEDMYAYHRSADVFLSSSRDEAFSYGLMEAISQNIPVAVSDIEGTKWSAEYSRAFIYPVESADACANAIINAVQTSDKESNYRTMVEKYGIEKWCDSMMDIFSKL